MCMKSITFLFLWLAFAIMLAAADGEPQAQQHIEPINNKIDDSSKAPQTPILSTGSPTTKNPKKGRAADVSDCPSPCTCSEKKITCEGKKLTTIPNFKKFGNINEISLRGNLIKVFDLKQLPSQGTIESLDLSSNKIDTLAGLSLSTVTKLKSLNLSGNLLKDVSSFADFKLPVIETLDISSNPIEELQPNVFTNFKSLQNLRLQQTNLRLIDEFAFSSLTQLKSLNMSGIKLTNHLGDKQFSKNQKLEVLDLSDNGLTEVPFALRSTSSLDRLILNRNLMTSLRSSDFINRTNLSHMEIRDCLRLRNIDELAFSDLSSLKTLILANNPKLQFISKDAFSTDKETHVLELLDLRGNNITTMPDIRESTTITFNQILLSDNPWHCSCELKWITTLSSRPILHCADPEQFKDLELSQYFLTTDCDAEESGYHSIILTGFLLFFLGIGVAIFIQKNGFCRRLMWKDQYGTIYYTKASFPPETV